MNPTPQIKFLNSLLMIGGLIALAPLAGEAAPRLVADVNQQAETIGANPSEMVAVGRQVFYAALNPVFGRELWVTDGREAGTRLVKDLRIGRMGSSPSKLRAVGSRVFFFADDGEHGVRLWSSDGVDTTMAGDTSIGSPGSIVRESTAVNGLLYSTIARSGSTSMTVDSALWRSDGTADGTWLLNPLDDVFIGRPFGFARLLTEMDGDLFFANLDRELWTSNGTTVGTTRIADFDFGARIISIAGAAGRLWITLDRGTTKELWSWSGGAPGLIATLPGGALASDRLTARNGRVFFVSRDPEAGIELWTSDGTITRLVADIREGTRSSSPAEFVWFAETLYFTAADGLGGRDLWASDGERAWPVKSWVGSADPSLLVAGDEGIYFLRNENGKTLWRSDGTTEGTLPVKQVNTPETAYGTPNLVAMGGGVFFRGNDGQAGFELWSSDGTPEGTGMLWDLDTSKDGWVEVYPAGAAAWGNDLVFRGDEGVSGEEPWLTDGTAEGTRLLADVRPGPDDSEPVRFAAVGGKLYFGANDGVHGRELWCSAPSGTALVRDINPGSASAYLNGMAAVGARLAFDAQDGSENGLWMTDGDQTWKVKGRAQNQLAALGAGLLFAAADAGHGEEPWWTDGETTRLVKDLFPGTRGAGPAWFTTIGNEAYFQAHGSDGFKLWRTDGTETGTVLVNGWQGGGEGPGTIYPLVAAGSRLFFFEAAGTSGLRLWTAKGGQSELVRQIGESGKDYPFGFPADPYVAACGEMVFFVANNGEHGDEVWYSDGTAAGTAMVLDIRPGGTGSAPVNLTTVGGMVFFQANDGIHGEELWVTNGTTTGTRLVADLVPGSGGSAPRQLVLAGKSLFFGAVTEPTGCEPFVLDVGPILDFHAWAEETGLSGLDAIASAIPHGDGIANLLKYAFGIDGASPYHAVVDGEPGSLPKFSTSIDGAERILQVEYVRRSESSLVYKPMRSTTLGEDSFVPMAGNEKVEPMENGWERVVRWQRADSERCFGRVEVTLPLVE